jgi:hypothetical protein
LFLIEKDSNVGFQIELGTLFHPLYSFVFSTFSEEMNLVLYDEFRCGENSH